MLAAYIIDSFPHVHGRERPCPVFAHAYVAARSCFVRHVNIYDVPRQYHIRRRMATQERLFVSAIE